MNHSPDAVVRRVVSPTPPVVVEIVCLRVPLLRFVVRTVKPARKGLSAALMEVNLLVEVIPRSTALRTSPSPTQDSNISVFYEQASARSLGPCWNILAVSSDTDHRATPPNGPLAIVPYIYK